ncbi:MAG TPA: shikimate kinase [Flavobacterium sp.]|nr:shikimate kinase [Flavobacterium sp.]
MVRKIILVGYMGVGKSVIAQKLSHHLKIDSYDVDDLIEDRLKLKVSEIFKLKGEISFRKAEHEVFKEYIENDKTFVMSTGGGTPCYFNNYSYLNNKNVVSIYLNASIETLYKRIINEKNKRPLVSSISNDELKEFIGKHLFERNYFYNQAKYKVDVDGKTTDEILAEIVSFLD